MPNRLLCAAAIAITAPIMATAQDYTFGQTEYMNSCAQCHGPAGKGDGPMSGFLDASLPDLTQIQKNNDGVFPVSSLYRLIDGTEISGIHGSSDMPAWGMRYAMDAPEQLGWDYTEADSRAFVRARVLALIEYLSTMQE